MITFGNGNNLLIISRILNNSAIIFGEGNNTAIIDKASDNSSMSFGNGDNLLFGLNANNYFISNIGIGNNLLLLNSVQKNNNYNTSNTKFIEFSNSAKNDYAIDVWNSIIDERNIKTEYSLHMNAISTTLDKIFNYGNDSHWKTAWE